MAQTEDPIRGIALSVGATVLFASADTTAKFLAASMPVVEIQWIRYVVFLGMALALARRTPLGQLRPRRPSLQIIRGLCVIGSSVLFVYGIRSMSMAQATTISFLSPLLVTVLSIPLLGEQVGIRRWAAVGAGFLGMLIVIRPGTGGFEPAALFGVASSSCWGIALILTRKMSATDAPAATILWSSAIGTATLTMLMPLEAVWPTVSQFALCVMLGVLASLGQMMVVEAHRLAPASLLAPFSYTQLLWVTVSGWLVFQNLPDQWTVVGAGIIIASGLYTAHRERVRARARQTPPPSGPGRATIKIN